MGLMERRKGARTENELAGILSTALGWVVRRILGQARDSGADIRVGKFLFESKARKRHAVYEYMDQVAKACGPGDVPVVALRGDGREWLVVMRLDDAIPLIRGELGDAR